MKLHVLILIYQRNILNMENDSNDGMWIGLSNEPVENNNNSSSLILDTLECCGISSTNNGENIMENSMKNMKAKKIIGVSCILVKIMTLLKFLMVM